MMRHAAVAILALAFAATPLAAQDYGGYASGYAQQTYDTDGQSVDSIDVFYRPLTRFGRWVDSRYGRVWTPNVGRDWRPYTIGHWEEGAYGQTWRSDEPFGWAVYHFGRWAFDPAIGWVWAPDTTWGPGWVAWRDSDDITGWAPLPPRVSVELAFGFGSGFSGGGYNGAGFNDWGYDQWYQPSWVYVPRGSLYSRSLRGVYLPYTRNRESWEHTRGITRYDRVDGQLVDRSFGGGGFGDRGFNDRRRDDRRRDDHRGDDRRGDDRRGDGDRRDGRDVRGFGGRTDGRMAVPYPAMRPGPAGMSPGVVPRAGSPGGAIVAPGYVQGTDGRSDRRDGADGRGFGRRDNERRDGATMFPGRGDRRDPAPGVIQRPAPGFAPPGRASAMPSAVPMARSPVPQAMPSLSAAAPPRAPAAMPAPRPTPSAGPRAREDTRPQ